MHNRTRMIATAAAVSAALAAGTAAAVASTTAATPGAHAKTMSASEEPGGTKAVGSKSAEERQGHAAIAAAVAIILVRLRMRTLLGFVACPKGTKRNSGRPKKFLTAA